MLKDFLLLIAGGTLTFLGGVFQSFFDAKRRREELIFESKRTCYSKLLGVLPRLDTLDVKEAGIIGEALLYSNTKLEQQIKDFISKKNKDFYSIKSTIKEELGIK
ncbi:MAG: hypothetical protein AAB534_00835 [Patescibacteria group bacterium]